ncbi:MAG TPA: homoserine kinase [Ilumatobacteraceae bacterium]
MICRVPATSANIGPGFDVLGVALTLWAEIGVIDAGGVPAGAHRIDRHHPADIALRRLGGDGELWERSPIPMGRGLGYSAAVRVGGLVLACAQRGGASDAAAANRDEILEAATALEGHADNAAPALLGGVCVTSGGRAMHVPLQLDPAVVVWVPSSTTSTDDSRAQLATTVARADAVFNIGRTAMLVAALASADTSMLRHASEDVLHQPQRFAVASASYAAYRAALDAGAWCAWLSGSGPTVAMMCAADAAPGLAAALPADGHSKVLRIDHGGATIDAG